MAGNLEEIAANILQRTLEARGTQPEIAERLQKEVDHGFDVLRWILWLEPNASQELRAAGILHDIERIKNYGAQLGFTGDRTSEAYKQYKAEHAARSAALALEELLKMEVAPWAANRTISMIEFHDHSHQEIQPMNDHELEILVSADSLAFFTSVAADMYQREGEESIKQKIIFMIRKMPPLFKQKLAELDFTNPEFGIESGFAKLLQRLKTDVLRTE